MTSSGQRAEEILTVRVALDVVERDDREIEDVEDRAIAADPVEPAGGAGEDELGVDVELVLELSLPLLGQVGRAEDREATDLATIEQFPGDQQGLDCLADADVVGDKQPDRVQLQGHQERHELIGPGLDGDLAEGPERAGTRSEAKPDRVAEQAAGLVVAELGRVGGREIGRAGSPRCPDRSRRPPRRCRPRGRTTRKSSCDSGSTTHSRFLALTSDPTAYFTDQPRSASSWLGAYLGQRPGLNGLGLAEEVRVLGDDRVPVLVVAEPDDDEAGILHPGRDLVVPMLAVGKVMRRPVHVDGGLVFLVEEVRSRADSAR